MGLQGRKIKLTFFKAMGRAEIARLLLAYGGIEFEDNRIESADWPALRPKTPFGTLPILEVDGTVIGQGLAIARFIASDVGLMGSNALERAEIEAIVDALEDDRNAASKIFVSMRSMDKEEDKAAALEKVMKEILMPHRDKYMKVVEKYKDSPYIVGNSISLADFRFWDNRCFYGKFYKELPKPLPKIEAIADKI